MKVLLDPEVPRQLEALLGERLQIPHAIKGEGADLLCRHLRRHAVHTVPVQHQSVGVNHQRLLPARAGLVCALVAQAQRTQLGHRQEQLVQLFRLVRVVACESW
jgi:hypothetical protein